MGNAEAPLSGYTVGITAERRADDFIAALERKGARIRHAPTIRIVPLADDDQLRTATETVLSRPIDLLVVMTGQGFRGWVSAAREWGCGDELLERYGAARVVVRGPKATGAVRGEGLTEEWSSPQETNADMLRYLLEAGVRGLNVALQVHGAPQPDFVDALTRAGASVTVAQPYRWLRPADVTPVFELIDGCVDGSVDAMAFTSAPAASNLLTLAAEHGTRAELLASLGSKVVCACVGPVTAAPLVEAGIPVIQPDRQRLGALVKLIAEVLPERATG